VINTFTVRNRFDGVNEQILNVWPKLADGRLDLAKAPFRLLAIVNRIDLRGNSVYGSTNAGEARMVFGLLRCVPAPPPPIVHEAQKFMAIFEYGIKKSTCADVRDWAQKWHALGLIALGSSGYNPALQAITDQFTLRDADPSKLPNESALNQLRTNEFAIARANSAGTDTDWELREFKICRDTSACGLGQLEQTTIAQTPDSSFQGNPTKQPLLRDFINDNKDAILDGTHRVPAQLDTSPPTPFLGGAVQPGGGFVWNVSGITNLEARHLFSKASCNGCHTRETGTNFVHIFPRVSGSASGSGIGVRPAELHNVSGTT